MVPRCTLNNSKRFINETIKHLWDITHQRWISPKSHLTVILAVEWKELKLSSGDFGFANTYGNIIKGSIGCAESVNIYKPIS